MIVTLIKLYSQLQWARGTGPMAATWPDTIAAVVGVIAATAAAGVIATRAVATRVVAETSDGLHGPPMWPRS